MLSRKPQWVVVALPSSVAGVSVGTTVRPMSARTGSSELATKWTSAPGQRLMIS